jgi:shikimate kinase
MTNNIFTQPKDLVELVSDILDNSDVKFETTLEEKYQIYHKDFSSAVQHAKEVAKKKGFEVPDEEWDNKVALGPRKPSGGKTNSYSLELTKGGKPQRKRLNMQVYNMDNKKFELNMYIESLDESVGTLEEGIHDPAIFKAVFLAGGPGSGKSFIVGRTALTSLGMRVVNSDPAFEKALANAGLEMTPDDIFSPAGQIARATAKKVTSKQQSLYVQGRLGLVIDGTGKDYDKIKKQKDQLEKLGYETAMIFVNTNLETAIARDAARSRTLGAKEVEKMWSGVQNNIGKFQGAFKARMFVVDNSEGADFNKDVMRVYRAISAWAKKPSSSRAAKKWISGQKAKRGIKENTELLEFTSKEIKMAIGIASDKRYAGGNMTGAVNAIEKIKKGLSKNKQVAAVLKRQNENLEEAQLDELKQPFVVYDTADGNKIVGMASDEKGAKGIITTSQLPPMKIKDKKTLKIAKVKKAHKIGQELKEEENMNPVNEKAPQIRGSKPKMKNNKIMGIRGKDGDIYDVEISLDGRKVQFRVANEFGDFKTISIAQAAKMFEEFEEYKFEDFRESYKNILKMKKEGTWALPDSPKAKAELKKLMSKPIKLGKEGDDAAKVMYSLIGDDELFDDLYVAGKKNPNGDARPVIKKAMKRLGIKEELQLTESIIDDMRDIVDNKQAKKIKGTLVDMFTASIITQIYDKVNDANKAKMEKLPLEKLVDLAYKMMKREEISEKTECPKCEGKGCEHCDNKGYHEELSAKQKKIDLNKNGKVDGDDLSKLRSKKEEFALCEGCETPKECMAEQSCMGKSEELKIDGRKKDFKEKLNKLGYKKEESDFDVETLIENSDKKDAKEMADLVKELEPKIKDKELQAQVYDLAMEKYKNKTRAKKIASYV